MNRLRQGQRFTNLVCFSLLSLSCSLLLSLYSTSLHILLTIFNTPHIINMLRTVRFPFTVVHMMLAMYTKLEWLVNCTVSFTQSTHTMHVTYTDYHPVWGSPQLLYYYRMVDYFREFNVSWFGKLSIFVTYLHLVIELKLTISFK